MIREPENTTCKYLHRKDLPRFVVEEGIREHAAEFATFSALVNSSTRESIPRAFYSEKYAWEHDSFDVVTNTLAQYRRTDRSWVFIEAFSSGIDGRRSLTHAALVRRYMDNCGTWISSYRLFLAFMQELDVEPRFSDRDLISDGDGDVEMEQLHSEALWDVLFTRISGIQEYGFHAGLEELMWATDCLGDGLALLDWPTLQAELTDKRHEWTERIIHHAKDQGVFFEPSHSAIDHDVHAP